MNVSEILTRWYKQHGRLLPWRDTSDPYPVWVSEIILQQTRVNQGIGYYQRFIERFPDIGALARASIDEVLLSWQGLGYYTRARNLHKTARIVYFDHAGRFPADYRELIKLPGIGDYTASAIASFCFGRPEAVVDGNVARVLARLEGMDIPINSSSGKKQLKHLANRLISHHDPATHNQAMIEFGALQCTPKQPGCQTCPLQGHCLAWKKALTGVLPVKARKGNKKVRYFYYIDITSNGHLLLHKRNNRDIWNSLYQFPLIEAGRQLEMSEISATPEWKHMFAGLTPEITGISSTYTHQLTHQKIYAQFIRVGIGPVNDQLAQNYRQFKAEEIENIAIPRLIEKYLEEEKYPKKA
jgi:A/G-specific adenine glycosylase